MVTQKQPQAAERILELEKRIAILQSVGASVASEQEELAILKSVNGDTAKPVPPATTTPTPIAAPATATDRVAKRVRLPVNKQDFESGGDFHAPTPGNPGIYKSVITDISMPRVSTATQKAGASAPQKVWIICETRDSRLTQQGRGVREYDVSGNFAWTLKRVLQGVGISYNFDLEGFYCDAEYPVPCQTDWQMVPIQGGKEQLRIQNLLHIDAKVEVPGG